jgi:selenocysteine-specific elongation factor
VRSLVLGTAGHIDHGKTALVRALTGVDTDRLKEEKARGITIELGFAELTRDGMPRFGVVDVPGHEAFVRAMLAGAAGMDVVLLVVAADEGVMPQTREHLAIVRLLGVRELIVAYTKCDLVEDEWLELVEADVEDLLADTPYAAAARVATSASTGAGIDALLLALADAAGRVPERSAEDLARLPLDRVFTIQGTGTVVTGTLWSGRISSGDRVRILPGELDARVRAVQVHGTSTEQASAGDRAAVALTGSDIDRDHVARGATLVSGPDWTPSWMLTTRVRVIGGSEWALAHNQRVHVHHGTTQVLARCALLDDREALAPGDEGWIQLRLEEPLVARGRDRFVLRSYSPVTTIAGGLIAEPDPPKRNRLDDETRAALEAALEGDDRAAVGAHLRLAGWAGARSGQLAVRLGLPPTRVDAALRDLGEEGALTAADRWFSADVRERAEAAILAAVRSEHERNSLRPAIPLASLRAVVPDWAPGALADAVLRRLADAGALVVEEGGMRDPEHRPTLSPDQERATARLVEVLTAAELAPPFVEELPADLTARPDLWSLLHRLESDGVLRKVSDTLYVGAGAIQAAEERVRATLGGRSGLGPSDFRDALAVSRKHLIPLLNYFDVQGVTLRRDDGRTVSG